MVSSDEEYREQCRAVYDKINTIEDVFNLTPTETELLLESVDEFSEAGVPYIRTLQDNIGKTPPKPITNIIGKFKNSLDRVEPNNFPVDDFQNYEKVTLWEIIRKAHEENGGVYLGVSLNDKRAEAVWEANPSNQIVSVQTTRKYNLFQEVLGWKLLKEVEVERL